MNTNDLPVIIQQAPAAAWHGFTMGHAFVAAIAGWVTHTNWPKVVHAGSWVAERGGCWGIARALIVGKAQGNSQLPIADSQAPIAK